MRQRVIKKICRFYKTKAVPIPKDFCEILGLGFYDEVEVCLTEDRRIIITPLKGGFKNPPGISSEELEIYERTRRKYEQDEI